MLLTLSRVPFLLRQSFQLPSRTHNLLLKFHFSSKINSKYSSYKHQSPKKYPTLTLKHYFSTRPSNQSNQPLYSSIDIPWNCESPETQNEMNEALALIKLKKIDQAMNLFQKALNKEPTNTSLMMKIAVQCDHLLRYAEALELLKAVLDLQPDHAHKITLKVFVMKYHYVLNQASEGTEVYNSLIDEFPNDSVIKQKYEECQSFIHPENLKFLLNSHKAIEAIQNNQDGIKQFEHLVNEVEIVTQNFRQNLELIYVRLCDHYYNNDISKCQHYLQKAQKLGFNHPNLMQIKALCLMNSGQNQKAAEIFREIKQSKTLNVNFNLAYAYFQSKDYLKAWETIQEHLDMEMDKNQSPFLLLNKSFYLVAECHLKLKNHQQIIQLTNRLIERKLETALVYYVRARAYYSLNSHQEAHANFSFVIDNQKDTSKMELLDSYYLRGNCKSLLGRYLEAIADYQTYLDKQKTNQVRICLTLGNIAYSYLMMKQYYKAIQYYNLALDVNPLKTDFYAFVSTCYLYLGELEKANQNMKRVDGQQVKDSTYIKYKTRIKVIETLVTLKEQELRQQNPKISQKEIQQILKSFVSTTFQSMYKSDFTNNFQLITQFPKADLNESVCRLKAQYYMLTFDYQKAKSYFQKVESSHPFFDTLVYHSFCCFKLNIPESAAEYFKKALEVIDSSSEWNVDEQQLELFLLYYYIELKKERQSHRYLQAVFDMALGEWDSALLLLHLLVMSDRSDSEEKRQTKSLIEQAEVNIKEKKKGKLILHLTQGQDSSKSKMLIRRNNK